MNWNTDDTGLLVESVLEANILVTQSSIKFCTELHGVFLIGLC